MPRASKRVAARQAELSKKKKHTKAPAHIAVDEPAVSTTDATTETPENNGNGNQAADDAAAPAPRAPARARGRVQADGEVSFRVPARSRGPAVAAGDTARRPLPQLPYLKQDLATLGIVCVAMVAILVVLSFFLL